MDSAYLINELNAWASFSAKRIVRSLQLVGEHLPPWLFALTTTARRQRSIICAQTFLE